MSHKIKLTNEGLRDLIKISIRENNLTEIECANVSLIRDMSSLFKDVKGISKLNLSSWNTSNVKNMNKMFQDSDFNSTLYFDTSNVTNMSFMFAGSKYNKPLNTFNTSKVTGMMYMFERTCYNYPLSHFSTLKVTDMSGMFANSLYDHSLDSFDTSNVINMNFMFFKSQFNTPLHFNTKNVTDMSAMFAHSKYNHPLNFSILNLEDIYSMFKNSSFLCLFETVMLYEHKDIDRINEVINLHIRNVILQKFIKTGKINDMDNLIKLCENDTYVIATIKKIYLENANINIKNEKITTLLRRM